MRISIQSGMRPRRPTHVLVVDDSAVVRETLTAILSQEPDILVTVASDPLIAMEKMKKIQPQVVVLDVFMPRMNGLEFLRWLMAENPIPVLICSEAAGSGTETALQALREGAVGIVTKPRVGVKQFLNESAVVLIDNVRAAAAARLRRPAAPKTARRNETPVTVAPAIRSTESHGRATLVAMGASTGGTEALREVLRVLPPECPGILVVQHMPELYTSAFARRLDQECSLHIKEASSGDEVSSGCVLIAPGNRHMALRRIAGRYLVEVSDGPLVNRHRPSVDVLFRSVAEVAGRHALGVIMTGMGEDGAEGLLQMRCAGAHTIAQDEASSVVFGMPKKAIERGAVEEVLSIQEIPGAILKYAHIAQPAISAMET